MKKYLYLLVVLLVSACSEKQQIKSAKVLSVSERHGLPIEICFENKFTSHYNARIRIETKSGLVLERSNIIIVQNKTNELCEYLNIYLYLLPKRPSKEERDAVEKNVFPGNIKSLEIYLSKNHGSFYEKESEFESYVVENI